MTVRQLDIIRDTVLRIDFPRGEKHARRQSDGRFSAAPTSSNGMADAVASVICAGYFASVCRMMGIDRDAAMHQLGRPVNAGLHFDTGWRRAAYARQLAMYLTATEANVPQAQLGRVTGLDRAGVHKALRAVEDLRDDRDYEDLIACVLVDVAMNARERAPAMNARTTR